MKHFFHQEKLLYINDFLSLWRFMIELEEIDELERKNDFLIENGPNTVLLNNASVITLIKAYGLWDKMSVPQET
ncbi:hypothetical protein N9Y26_01260 [bacterium]|nr:hypothetical protein [bacterium]